MKGDWRDDRGHTTLPCIYVGFNEVDDINNSIVPGRQGFTSLDYRATNYTIDADGHVFYEQDDTMPANSSRFLFGSVVGHLSRHDLVMSPHLHIGEHIVTSFTLKWGKADTAFSFYKNLFFLGIYAGTGGYLFEVSATGVLRHYIFANNGDKSGTPTAGGASAAGMCPKNTPLRITASWYVQSEIKMTCRVWIADMAGNYMNGGLPVINFDVNGPVPNFSVDGGRHMIGHEGGIALDLKDYLVIASPVDPSFTILENLTQWYKNPNNTYKLPDFLRAPTDLKADRRMRHGLTSTHIDGTAGKTILSMCAYLKRYGFFCSVIDYFHIGLGIAAFQTAEGVYDIAGLRTVANLCQMYGFKLILTFNDQTYNAPAEVPDHFPHWKKHSLNSSNAEIVAKAAMYWDDPAFNVTTQILQNPNFGTYNPALANNGTYRWLHHIWTAINVLKNHPAFGGMTLGETSGQVVGARDRSYDNDPAGRFNRAGIAGITDASGVYLLNKCYTMGRQRIGQGKVMQMVYDMCRHRSDLINSLQINWFRTDQGGAPVRPVYDKTTKTFTRASHNLRNGDAQFLWKNSWPVPDAGVQYDVCYYVVNATTNTYQLALTPGGAAIEFAMSFGTSHGIYFAPISQYLEQMVDKSRDSYTIDGMVLSDQTRELKLLADAMYQYGFVPSGPDVLAFELEKPVFYIGPYVNGAPGVWSVVEARLAMSEGTGLFAGKPLGYGEVQIQESVFGNETDPWFNAILPAYGPYVGGRQSLEQAHRYIRDRQKVRLGVWFNVNTYATQKFMPDGYLELAR